MTPHLKGWIFVHPPDARSIYLNIEVPCNGTMSCNGGRIRYWGWREGAAQMKVRFLYEHIVIYKKLASIFRKKSISVAKMLTLI